MGAWASELRLDGFFYDRLGGLLGSGDEADMLDRPVDWYRRWLARGPIFSPQPYEQLAKVLRNAGHSSKANDVLYTSREREQSWESARQQHKRWWKISELWHYRKWLGFSLLKCTIGYGLGERYFRVLYWVVGLTVIGTIVLATSGAAADKTTFWMAACSFDQLIPLVELKKEYVEFVQNKLTNGAELYFYFHKIMGYVLGSFLVAGLGGLTQR